MSEIYGICEPGAQLQPDDLEPMWLALGAAGRKELPLGGMGALLGATSHLTAVSLEAARGSVVAVDADLLNYDALISEHTSSNGTGVSSVAELVSLLYAQQGVSFVERLEGSFSLALWDSACQRLVLAIDRFGFKTLYWSRERERLLFSSRLKAIASAKSNVEIDPNAVMQYLVHTVVPAPLTIYRGIERLEPGTVLVYERQQARKARYWDLNYEELHNSDVGQWSEQVRDCIRQAVHSHLTGCGPEQIGAYLSGGTDSSSVAGFASQVHAPFNTFSIYFENPRYDEAAFSRLAAEHFQTRHHQKCLQASDAAQVVPRLVEYYDEPFANSSAIGAYYCAHMARENGVDLLLAGDGGDELFAGNERYATDKKFAVYHSVPGALRNSFIKPAVSVLPCTGPLSYPARYIRRAEIPNPMRMLSYSFFLSQEGLQAFQPEFLEQAKPDAAMEIAQGHFDSAPHATSELNRLLYLDVKMTLADNDLRKVVGTAEMVGVKVRFPLLDRRLAELSARIPSRLKLRGFEKRFIFKKAMKGILPEPILYKKKHGFGVPVGYWSVHDPGMKALAAVLEEPQARQRGYFRPEFLSRLKELNATHPAYYGEVLWSVLVLELWHRQHRDCLTGQSATCVIGVASAS
jgi:asparagine synthase (glutamine-hydrolysing)